VKRLLISYHSQSGSTQRMADAVHRGALRESEVQTLWLPAFDTTVQHMLESNAYIFGTPENFGYMSGALKDLFDRTYYPTEGKLVQRPYAVFIKAGNDGSGTLRSIERIVTGMQLKKVADAVICRGDVSDDVIVQCEELGQALAAGLALGIF
jgi:multimeric flavodoxin WrbA